MIQLKTQAIHTALTGDWQNAVNINQLLLQENPSDIDTLNRLAFAYLSLGNIQEAKNTYQKVLLLDQQNPIALKNLKRLNGNLQPVSTTMNNIFIEEPGKTKIVEIRNIAEQKIISRLYCGQSLTLSIKRMKIFLHDDKGQYIGMLPDDLGRRLMLFIQGGNSYEAFVKTATHNKVVVFLRESKRAPKFKNQPSFISSEKTKFIWEKTAEKTNDNND